MNEVDVLDARTERGSALDAFARSSEAPQQNALTIPAGGFNAPAERVFGAQAVAVHRDESRVLQKLKALAAAAGDDWYYRFPVKNRKENRTDYIEGASIKLANDLARMYGNCEVDTRVQDLGDSWLIYARFTDYETGFALTRPFQQRKSGSRMGGDDDARRLDIAFQIGVSKAIRNVVTNALQTFADFAFEEAKGALVDKIGKRLPEYRASTARRLSEKIDIRRAEAIVGRPVEEWLAPDIARVIAMMKAVSDGMAAIDETFPPLAPPDQDQAKPAADTKLQDFADQAKKDDAPGRASEGAGPGAGEPVAGAASPASKPAEASSGEKPEQAAGAVSQAGEQEDQESPHGQLIVKLRAAAAAGKRKLQFAYGKLTEAENALLTLADRNALAEAAAQTTQAPDQGA